MKYQAIVAAFLQLSAVVSGSEVFGSDINHKDYYNILTIDGGGIRGLIPAMVLQQMETYAFTYATSKKYVVPQYPFQHGKIAMKDLFNMTAGTSTGSILAAGLSYPNATFRALPETQRKLSQVKVNGEVYEHPGFFADGLIDIYAVMGGKIFVPNTLGFGWVFLWFVFIIGIFAAAGYLLGAYHYDNSSVTEAFKAFRQVISASKRQRKGKGAKVEGETPLAAGTVLGNQLKEKLLEKVEDELGKQQKAILASRFGKTSEDFNRMLQDGIKEHVAEANANLTEAEKSYNRKKSLKWVVFSGFVIVGIVLGIEIPAVTQMLGASKYSRKSLDNIMHTLLGQYRFPDALTQELMVVAYEYNSQEPRFYSKYFAHQDPAIYDVPIGNATGSSSAAPTFFDPHQVNNGYGYTELQIDGGVICNNPALYAYEMARDLYGYRKIRVLSLGTGQLPFTKVKPEDFSILTAVSMKSEFMMNMDAYSADYWLKTEIPDSDANYHRAQMVSKLSMDDISPTAITNLKAAGEDLWTANKKEIQAMLRLIIDERFHTAAVDKATA